METQPKVESRAELKENLLSGAISPKEFCDKLIELDQSTPDRMNAIENLEILNDPEIFDFVKKLEDKVIKHYYQILSFAELHVGQIKSLSENNDSEALGYFKNALLHEYQANNFQSNIDYEKGIIAYFENNPDSLSESITDSVQGNNRKILLNMLNGLKERGFPNYKEDYRV